jgi:plasmid stabilization system protein ParE
VSGYVLSVDADYDLDDIRAHIAADNIDAADCWIEKLFDAFEALAQTPGMGHRREDLTSSSVLSRRPVRRHLSRQASAHRDCRG